jgi:hypothetical protein
MGTALQPVPERFCLNIKAIKRCSHPQTPPGSVQQFLSCVPLYQFKIGIIIHQGFRIVRPNLEALFDHTQNLG